MPDDDDKRTPKTLAEAGLAAIEQAQETKNADRQRGAETFDRALVERQRNNTYDQEDR